VLTRFDHRVVAALPREGITTLAVDYFGLTPPPANPLAAMLPLYRAVRAARVPSPLYRWPRGSRDWPGAQGAPGIAHAAAFLRRYLR